MAKKPTEIMDILDAYYLTRSTVAAARLTGADDKTVASYVQRRDQGQSPASRAKRPSLIDPFLAKIEELVERSRGLVRADVVHDHHLVGMGYQGSRRTTRRTVAQLKAAYLAGTRRSYRPWIPEPGMWAQYDWGTGPTIHGRKTQLFCAWLAWSRYRVVIPTWDRTLATTIACVDRMLQTFTGAPTYLLTDNEKTVTTTHIAHCPVRHPEMAKAGQHYGVSLKTCIVRDPESKGGSEATVRVAKADIVPTETNLLPEYGAFAELEEACRDFCVRINERSHRVTKKPPAQALREERAYLHCLPDDPYLIALGEERLVHRDQMVRLRDVGYSTPPEWVGCKVRVRVEGEEVVITGVKDAAVTEVARHRTSTPGNPRIDDAHYPDHPHGQGILEPKLRPKTDAERDFLAIGCGAEVWLREACAQGIAHIRKKMAKAVDLSRCLGTEDVDKALGIAAVAGRFDWGDLESIADHLRLGALPTDVVADKEPHSTQPGTSTWEGFGT